jgi:hypothetical protein
VVCIACQFVGRIHQFFFPTQGEIILDGFSANEKVLFHLSMFSPEPISKLFARAN